MDTDTALKIMPIVVSGIALIVSGWVALRDRARPKIIVRQGKGAEFTKEKFMGDDADVLAILVINQGRRVFTLDTVDPLRLLRADGSVLKLPDSIQSENKDFWQLAYTFGRPDNGRLGENDGFLVLMPLVAWVWFRIGDEPPVVAVQVLDITGLVKAKKRLPKQIASWFNQDKKTALVSGEIRGLLDRAKQRDLEEFRKTEYE